MSEQTEKAMRAALRVAFRHFPDLTTTESERDAILRAMAEFMDSPEAEEASRALFHREQARAHQMTLGSLLDPTSQKN